MFIKEITLINPKSNVKFNYYINYIDTSAVNDGALVKVDYLSNKFPSRAQRQLQYGDILISSVRPNLKHNYFVNCDKPHLIGSTGFIQVRNNSNKYNSKYLYYFLTSQPRVDLYTSIANFSQTAFPSFNKDVLENLHISEISISEQNHIVNTISFLLLKSL